MANARERSSQYRVVAADTVKFGSLRRLLSLWGFGIALAGVGQPALAQPERRELPLLLGGPRSPQPSSITTDPRLPTGADFRTSERPRAALAACSARVPVCVHAAPHVPTPAIAAASDALEQAFERLVTALGLPEPRDDGTNGGSGALDLYLVPADDTTPPFERVRSYGEPLQHGSFDSIATFCTAQADDAALLQRAATLCVGEAIAARLDPAETPHLRRAFATSLWWTVGLPTSFDFEAIDIVQRRPTRAIAARELTEASEGSALFFEYLDRKLGAGGPAELSTALFAASAQRTPPDARSWLNEPDLFDVLRHTLDEDEAKLARLLGDFGVARAFVGDREDGEHLPELAWAGRFGAPVFDWVIPYATLPRRVRVTPPEPTGVVLLWVDLSGAPAGIPLGFQAEWEPPAQFQWTLVRLGADGSELGRLEVPFQSREAIAEARLVELGGARALLVVGAHNERVDVDQPFDPDVAPFEPHGALVYLVEL